MVPNVQSATVKNEINSLTSKTLKNLPNFEIRKFQGKTIVWQSFSDQYSTIAISWPKKDSYSHETSVFFRQLFLHKRDRRPKLSQFY